MMTTGFAPNKSVFGQQYDDMIIGDAQTLANDIGEPVTVFEGTRDKLWSYGLMADQEQYEADMKQELRLICTVYPRRMTGG
jgi:hypothetical protein